MSMPRTRSRAPALAALACCIELTSAVVHAGEEAPSGTLDVTTSDGRGTIFIDEHNAGEGSFHGTLVVGEHQVSVERAGFRRFVKRVVVDAGKSASLAVTLAREEAAPPPPAPAPVLGGAYGGFFLGPSFEPAGSGSTFEQTCPLTGALSCSAGPPAGLTIAGYAGYTWDPIGLELFGAFGLDYTSPSSTFDGVVQPGSNAALTGPARNEQFQILRVGGMAAVRARATIDGKKLRVSFALGPGFGVHGMLMERTATTTGSPSATDAFVPQPISYATPALSMEVAVAYRLSSSVSLTAGLSTWLENAGTDATTTADPRHYIFPLAVPLRTPSYRLASGTQFFLWPFLGMQFGP